MTLLMMVVMELYQCAKFYFLILYGFGDTVVETEEEEQQGENEEE